MIRTKKVNRLLDNRFAIVENNDVIFPDGSEAQFFRALSPNKYGVVVLAINENDEILLVEEYRYNHKNYVINVPMGDGDEGAPIDRAKEELLEETGYIGHDWEQKISVHQQIYKEQGSIFFTTKVHSHKDLNKSNPENSESILSARFYGKDEVRKMVREGRINESMTIIAINMWLFGDIKKVRTKTKQM